MVDAGVRVRDFKRGVLICDVPDVWHLHWPEQCLNEPSHVRAALRTRLLLAQLKFARARGIRVVWTVHNTRPHERLHARLERAFWPSFLALLSGWIALSKAGHAMALEHHPQLARIPSAVIAHGHYRDWYPAPTPKEEARICLGLPTDAIVLLYFGQIRPYKNIEHLLEVFARLNRQDMFLVIAGSGRTEFIGPLRRSASSQPNVKAELRFIGDGEVATFFGAADGVVLPYRDILNSGTALLALSMDRRVLVPGLGAMQDLADAVGDGWVIRFDGELSSSTLERFAGASLATPGSPNLSAFDWNKIGRLHREFFEAL